MNTYLITYRKNYTGGELINLKKKLQDAGGRNVEIRPCFICFLASQNANLVPIKEVAKQMNSVIERVQI